MRQLLREASRLGVEVHIAHIEDDPTLLGYFLPYHRIIVIRFGMTRAQTRTVLAHELGHAFYGHDCDTATAERQADTYAARLLIDPAQYASLEQINADRHYLADEMAVTPELIDVYRTSCLTTLRGITYAHPRMGVGQWAHRSAYA